MDEINNTPEPQKWNISISSEVAEGTHANLAIIGHTQSEFVIDFIRTIHGTDNAVVKSRIILSPDHAKRFVNAMLDNIAKYQIKFGNIQDLPNPLNSINYN